MRIIAACRIGTTVATNALLEHKGDKFAFVTTKGIADREHQTYWGRRGTDSNPP